MKKTIFSLLAVAGLSMSVQGATLADAFYSSTDITTDTVDLTEYGYSGSITLTCTLDTSVLASYVGSTAGSATHLTGLISLTSADGNIAASMGNAGGSNGIFGSTALGNVGSTIGSGQKWSCTGVSSLGSIDFSQVTAAALTISHTASTSTTLILSYELDGTTYVLSGNNSGLKYSSGFDDVSNLTMNTNAVTSAYVIAGAADVATATALNASAIAASIPEPATASLSLLGLAALMMRRRRG